jgi:cytochrome c556
MIKARVVLLAIAAITGMYAGMASGQFSDAEAAIKYRQGAFHMMSIHMQRINAYLRGDIPFDRQAVTHNAELVRFISTLPWDAFPPGSEGGNAQDDIWLDDAQFQDWSKKLQGKTKAFSELAVTASPERLNEAYKDMRSVCRDCHQHYRNPLITRGN